MNQAALVTRPDLMHLVQAFILRGTPSIKARTRFRLGLKARFFLLLAWLTWFPETGPFPQISHLNAIRNVPPIEKYQIQRNI